MVLMYLTDCSRNEFFMELQYHKMQKTQNEDTIFHNAYSIPEAFEIRD